MDHTYVAMKPAALTNIPLRFSMAVSLRALQSILYASKKSQFIKMSPCLIVSACVMLGLGANEIMALETLPAYHDLVCLNGRPIMCCTVCFMLR